MQDDARVCQFCLLVKRDLFPQHPWLRILKPQAVSTVFDPIIPFVEAQRFFVMLSYLSSEQLTSLILV